jgi:DNA helicase-2/ATP-dependent DNA helicase PcrA
MTATDRGGDCTVAGLTAEQKIAAGTSSGNLFINAGPGTGKTTVSAHRFAVQRFLPTGDNRAVVAVSFTRAATWNLRQRVQRTWGRSATIWPHRIVTLDTIICELVHDLLKSGLLTWPNGHAALIVHDSWNAFSSTERTREAYQLKVTGGQIFFVSGKTREPGFRVPLKYIIPRLNGGICTHEDVRDVLGQALREPRCAERIQRRLSDSIRGLIVDEVFDANALDLEIIELAIKGGVAVTLVGDPWQALYQFRGAKPEAVSKLIARANIRTLPLMHSFRWRDGKQQELARRLRSGEAVTLLEDLNGGADSAVNVVLSLFWKDLWSVGKHVLPLAFHAFKGGYEEAAATLLLNHVTRNILSEDATYLGDSLTVLAIDDPDVPRRIELDLQDVVNLLLRTGKPALNAAYARLTEVIESVSPRRLRPAHAAHTGRLALITERVKYGRRPVLGLTTHQAKGREWDVVGVKLTPSDSQTLARGLDVNEDISRKLYVACTRARILTVSV